MKKIIYSFLVPGIIASFLVLSAASPFLPDKHKKNKSKPSKEKPQQLMLLRDSTNCANYYEASCSIQQLPHNSYCPDNCTLPHTKIIVGNKTLKTCPKGKLYNAQKLACDFPENVACPHTPKCTNN